MPDAVHEAHAFAHVCSIDSVAPKVELIRSARRRGMRVMSSMGAGGRLDPTRVVAVR
jgi:tRNA A37 threonylcarbamoyladenosine dehydratase